MPDSTPQEPSEQPTGLNAAGRRPSRREFLKLSALAAVAAGGTPSLAGQIGSAGSSTRTEVRGNSMPGRIVRLRDSLMVVPPSTFNMSRIEQNVLWGVRLLTGVEDTGSAFQSLFPGLHSGSKIAIKINCIGPTDSRWQTARGVVSGLSLMLGGTYDVSHVTIFDNQPIFSSEHGYNAANFVFGGHTAVLSDSNNAGSYQAYPGYHLSNYIVNADYVIDLPVLKSHNDANNQITAALKNHYGSCSPSSLCGNITGMLTVNADANIKNKTCLVVLDALRGTYTGDPGQPAQLWNTFPEHTPNTLGFSTDPVTIDYWARDMINVERATHSWANKPCPWIETASGSPYSLGVSNPAQMTVINLDAAHVEEDAGVPSDGTFLAPNVPNPFRESTQLRFRLAEAGTVSLAIWGAAGQIVRRIASGELPAGPGELVWDGRDEARRPVPAGVYFVRLEAGRQIRTRRITLLR